MLNAAKLTASGCHCWLAQQCPNPSESYTNYATCNRTVVTSGTGSASVTSPVIDYIYDAENRLIEEKIDAEGDGSVDRATLWVYDGNQIVLQFDKDISPLPVQHYATECNDSKKTLKTACPNTCVSSTLSSGEKMDCA